MILEFLFEFSICFSWISSFIRLCQISQSYLGCSTQVATMVLSWVFRSSGDPPFTYLGVIPKWHDLLHSPRPPIDPRFDLTHVPSLLCFGVLCVPLFWYVFVSVCGCVSRFFPLILCLWCPSSIPSMFVYPLTNPSNCFSPISNFVFITHRLLLLSAILLHSLSLK